ncbi:MAG: hemerythrin domain-containing protein [Rhodocyclaceae bacterium]|jgi:methyl-accepting chemotaxis protein/hemerythrin|nr:hemerythrin domain-containing protein [Rhodocyclaceae bacterium]
MPFLWSAGLETGIREIDLQHQELFEIGNALEQAALDGQFDHATEEILPRLHAYVLFHFGTEERLLAGHPVPAAHRARHLAEHEEFTTRITALRQHALSRDGLLTLIAWISGWITEHIAQTDREMAKLLRPAAVR